jgi:hypothetical protein
MADQGDAVRTDKKQTQAHWWLRADPVHMRADLHQIRLFDTRLLAIEEYEARTLTAAINHELGAGASGWVLEAPVPERWYLRLSEDPAIDTHPLTDVINQDIRKLMPYGRQAKNWHALLTEIQMLLYNSEINRQRELAGRPEINSVWFWGGGRVSATLLSPAEGIYANDPLTRGLARCAQTGVSFFPDTAADWLESAGAEASSLLVIDRLRYAVIDRDFHSWSEQLQQLDRDWLEACIQWLKKGQIDRILLYPGNGRTYLLTAGDLRRFWRSARALSHYLG